MHFSNFLNHLSFHNVTYFLGHGGEYRSEVWPIIAPHMLLPK